MLRADAFLFLLSLLATTLVFAPSTFTTGYGRLSPRRRERSERLGTSVQQFTLARSSRRLVHADMQLLKLFTRNVASLASHVFSARVDPVGETRATVAGW